MTSYYQCVSCTKTSEQQHCATKTDGNLICPRCLDAVKFAFSVCTADQPEPSIGFCDGCDELFTPYEAILLKGHLDENEVREALEDELGDKDHVDRLMRYGPIHTYGKPLPQGTWWLTPDPKPKQRTTPITLIG